MDYLSNRRPWKALLAPLIVAPALLLASGDHISHAQTKAAPKPARTGVAVEVEGLPTNVNHKSYRFIIAKPTKVKVKGAVAVAPPFTIVTTARTKFEDRNDRTVSRAAFFRDIRANEELEVKGRLVGKTVTADKVEVD